MNTLKAKDLLTKEEKIWVDAEWEKLDKKLKKVSERSREKLPFWSYDGLHDNMAEKNIHCWTNGFWPGLMWLMYAGTKNEEYKKTAERGEELLDGALLESEKLGHDVGFMWMLASSPNYKLTKNHKSWQRLRRVTDHLMGRYNAMGGFIRAWNWGKTPMEKAGWTIIDCMMNMPLLYWASEEVEDPRFKFVAMKHSDTTIRDHIRPDGSVRHVVMHDPYTGEYLGEDETACQGFGIDSSWSRGQAWALYGFVLGYIHTEKEEYLNAAKQIAHYFIASVSNDWLVRCDFRSPDEPVYYDTSAAACAACGLIELAGLVPEYEKRLYLNGALNILKATEKNFADWSDETDFILGMATGSYRADHNMNIIYADYFYAEAIYKLKGFEPLFW